MQSDTGKALFCYSDSTIKINRIGLFYNPCYSKRINMPVSCAKAGNYLALCLFAVSLGLEGFAFLLRNNTSCLGLWVLKNIKLKIHPLFGKDGWYDFVNPLNVLVIEIILTTVLYGIYSHEWSVVEIHGDTYPAGQNSHKALSKSSPIVRYPGVGFVVF